MVTCCANEGFIWSKWKLTEPWVPKENPRPAVLIKHVTRIKNKYKKLITFLFFRCLVKLSPGYKYGVLSQEIENKNILKHCWLSPFLFVFFFIFLLSNLFDLGLWCLTPLPTIFQLYRGGQFFWWSRPEDLEKETGIPGENHWPVATHWQTLSHHVVHHALIEIQTHNISGDRHWLHR